MKRSKTFVRHLRAIQSGTITKSNVIGLRKIFNAQWRRDNGYSVSVTAPAVTAEEVDALRRSIEQEQPCVAYGPLHASGVKLLRDQRYAKRWTEGQARIIANLTGFRLVGFIEHERGQFVPAYKVFAEIDGKFAGFRFYNVAWQSGGDGPQVII